MNSPSSGQGIPEYQQQIIRCPQNQHFNFSQQMQQNQHNNMHHHSNPLQIYNREEQNTIPNANLRHYGEKISLPPTLTLPSLPPPTIPQLSITAPSILPSTYWPIQVMQTNKNDGPQGNYRNCSHSHTNYPSSTVTQLSSNLQGIITTRNLPSNSFGTYSGKSINTLIHGDMNSKLNVPQTYSNPQLTYQLLSNSNTSIIQSDDTTTHNIKNPESQQQNLLSTWNQHNRPNQQHIVDLHQHALQKIYTSESQDNTPNANLQYYGQKQISSPALLLPPLPLSLPPQLVPQLSIPAHSIPLPPPSSMYWPTQDMQDNQNIGQQGNYNNCSHSGTNYPSSTTGILPLIVPNNVAPSNSFVTHSGRHINTLIEGNSKFTVPQSYCNTQLTCQLPSNLNASINPSPGVKLQNQFYPASYHQNKEKNNSVASYFLSHSYNKDKCRDSNRVQMQVDKGLKLRSRQHETTAPLCSLRLVW